MQLSNITQQLQKQKTCSCRHRQSMPDMGRYIGDKMPDRSNKRSFLNTAAAAAARISPSFLQLAVS
jgi:hypothetical protein